MKIQTLLTAILGVVFISGLSLSREPASPEPMLEESLLARSSSLEPSREALAPEDSEFMNERARRRVLGLRPSDANMTTVVFRLRYFPVDDLEELIERIFSIDRDKIHADRGSNRLIIQATADQMSNVKALIAELDVPESEVKGGHTVDNLVYRVFMFEIPSEDQDVKPFSMILEMPSQVSSTELLNLAKNNEIQISDFLIIDERDNENDILLQGKAPSNESIKKMVEEIPEAESQIKELKWDDDETFTRRIGAAHYSRLPAQIQKHIQKFLGEDIITVGYWFGSSSIPGEVEAPIGPWKLQLELSLESDRTLELRVDVETLEEREDFDRRLGREKSDEILSNTILAKIGKPIIIGYNRQSHGTRKMGAMVIIPETMQLNTSEPANP